MNGSWGAAQELTKTGRESLAMDDAIRDILAKHGKLDVDAAALDEKADLYDNGLTSHACVNVMLALEETFDVEFPDELLRKETFSSITTIQGALAQIGVSTDA
jgi:acyl carrier protein